MLLSQIKALSKEEAEDQLKETFAHLTEGRYRIALSSALRLFDSFPNDFRIAICLAWAYLENGDANLAMEYADIAVSVGKSIPQTRLYRGFILMRIGVFEGAINDLDTVIISKSEPLSWAHHLKAKALAGLKKYQIALEEFEYAIKTDKNQSKSLLRLRNWYRNAAGVQDISISKVRSKERSLIDDAEDAYKVKEFWYSLWAIKLILAGGFSPEDKKRAYLLEIETLFALFQTKPAADKAKFLFDSLKDDPRFQHIYNKLINTEKKKNDDISLSELEEKLSQNEPAYKPVDQVSKPASSVKHSIYQSLDSQLDDESSTAKENSFAQPPVPNNKVITLSKRTDFQRFEHPEFIGFFARMLDLNSKEEDNEKAFVIQYPETTTTYIGVEAIISNPYHQMKEETFHGQVVWILNNNELGRHDFEIPSDRTWKHIVFSQTWGTDNPGYWKRGQGCVEIYMKGKKVCERWFLIGYSAIPNTEEIDIDSIEKELAKHGIQRQQSQGTELSSEDPSSVKSLLEELDKARLGHAAVEIVEPAWALSHLRGREAWALPLGLPEAPAAVLAIGAALSADRALRLPAEPRWGPGFTEQEAYRALSNARLPREKVEDPAAWARERLAAGEAVVWAEGRASFLDTPLGPRVRLVPGPSPIAADPRWVGPDLGRATAAALVAPDGLPALSPLEVVSAWRALGGRLVLGGFVV